MGWIMAVKECSAPVIIPKRVLDELVKTMQAEWKLRKKSMDDRYYQGNKDVEDMMKKGS